MLEVLGAGLEIEHLAGSSGLVFSGACSPEDRGLYGYLRLCRGLLPVNLTSGY
jgi:hypothetical protein